MDKDVAGLVERLGWHREDERGKLVLANPDGQEAASTIRAQAVEIERLQRHVEILQDKVDPDKSCACGYDDPDHVCLVHSPKLREAVEVLQAMKQAWESLEGNQYHSTKAVERWLWDDMKPVMDDLRAFLATMEKPNEP